MVSVVRLPLVALVPQSDVERIRQKLARAHDALEKAEFWLRAQAKKQPVLIQENEPTLPPYLTRGPVDYDEGIPIG